MRHIEACRISLLLLLIFSIGCSHKEGTLQTITHAQFKSFVDETHYITDAEKFGWSFVQEDVYNFRVVQDATWRLPDGQSPPASPQLPVTQVSYNDAIAYCQWAKVSLPTYQDYWEYIQTDSRKVVSENNAPISEVDKVNVLGNVWDITQTTLGDSTRLAGGSLFCSKYSCHGTVKERELYVDKQTGNIHIGFSVIVYPKK